MSSQAPLPPEEMAQRVRARIAFLDALLAANERRVELMDVIWAASDMADAVTAVARLLSVTPGVAKQVVEMRLMRMTRAEVDKLKTERDELARRLDEN